MDDISCQEGCIHFKLFLMGWKEHLGFSKNGDPAEELAGVLLVRFFQDAAVEYEKEMIRVPGLGKTLPDFSLSLPDQSVEQVLLEITKSSYCAYDDDPKGKQWSRLSAHVAGNPGVEAAVLYRENLATSNAQLASMMVVGGLARGELSTEEARTELLEVAESFGPLTPQYSFDVPWLEMIAEWTKNR
jgi:hypothetical protein